MHGPGPGYSPGNETTQRPLLEDLPGDPVVKKAPSNAGRLCESSHV